MCCAAAERLVLHRRGEMRAKRVGTNHGRRPFFLLACWPCPKNRAYTLYRITKESHVEQATNNELWHRLGMASSEKRTPAPADTQMSKPQTAARN